jgi:parallel beta-helix repeat protein
VAALACLLIPARLLATELLVPETYATIQAALDVAAAGDVVSVAPGLYPENVRFASNDVTLRSRIRHGATIQGSGHVVDFDSYGGAVEGFVITGAVNPKAGIFTSDAAQVIRDNLITGNGDDGIHLSNGSVATIDRNIIIDNAPTGYHSGIRINSGASATIVNNYIEGSGVGIWDFTFSGAADIFNNTLVDNSNFGVLITSGAMRRVRNNIITGSEFGIFATGSYDPDLTVYVGQFLEMDYNLLWGNSEFDYYAYIDTCGDKSCDANEGPFDPLPGTSEVYADPLLDPVIGYELSAGSPAIDAGDDGICPAIDLDGRSRPSDGDDPPDGFAVCDIGAVEYLPEPHCETDCMATCESPDLHGNETLVSGPEPPRAWWVDLAWTGTGYGVFWTNNQFGSPDYGLHFTPLDAAGNLSGADLLVADDPEVGIPVLVWTGQEHGLAWDVGDEIQFTRLDAMGNRLAPNIPVTSDPAYSAYPDMIWTGAGYALTWEDERDGNAEIYFARLDSVGTRIGNEVRVTEASGHSFEPLLAWSETVYGLTWYDNRDGFYRVYFVTLDSEGRPVGPVTRLSNGEYNDYPTRILWTGGEFAVFWTTEDGVRSQVFLSHLDPSGTRTAPDVLLTEGVGSILVADVAWVEPEYGYILNEWLGDETRQTFIRSSATGVPIGSPLEINAVRHVNHMRLRWNGQGFAIAYNAGVDRTSSHDVFWQSIGCDCTDEDGDGATLCRDCNDADPSIYPTAPEQCNGVDDNCDGVIDDGFDADADTFTSCGGDCDDGNPTIYPGALEICDGLDNDCNALADDGPDLDGDGHTVCDCAPDDPDLYIVPGEVANMFIAPDQMTISWDSAAPAAGPATVHDLSRGIHDVTQPGALSPAICLQSGLVPAMTTDETFPPEGFFLWYLVRGRNACGSGTYGAASDGTPRPSPVCP